MTHGILGAGAIGGLVGTALASLGETVTMVVRPESLGAYPTNVTLERPQDTITARATAAVALTEPVDVLWIATKAYQLQAALEAVRAAPTHAVPLLNGVDHVEVLRARFGHGGVLPATIAVEAEKMAPGRFLQRSSFVRLNVAASGETPLQGILRRLGDLGFTCHFVANEHTLLWSKLCFLAPFALVTSASDMNKGEILTSSAWAPKLAAAIAEACAVARAIGAEADPLKVQAIVDGMPPTMRSSMQKDLAAGHQVELDAIAGPIVRGGKRYGIDVPVTVGLVTAIRARMDAHQA